MGWFKKVTGIEAIEHQRDEYKALAMRQLDEHKALQIQAASRTVINSNTVQYDSWDVFSGKDRYLTNGDVYAVIKKMQEACARMPMYTYRVVPDEVKAFRRMKSLSSGSYIDGNAAFSMKIAQTKALEDVEADDPVETLLNTPNPYQTRTEFLEAVYHWKIKKGKVRIVCISVDEGINAGRIQEIYALQPDKVGIKTTSTFPRSIEGYTYRVPGTAQTIDIPVEDMIADNNFNPDDDFNGLSPLQPGSKNIQRGESAEDVSTRQLQNGGVPGIVYTEAADGSDAETQTQLDTVRDVYNDFITNPNNKGKLFWAAGKVGVAQTGSTLTDLAVIDGENQTFRKFCRNMGISPLLFGDTQGFTYENYKEAKKDAYTSVYLPIVFRIAEKLTRGICDTQKDGIKRVLHVDLSGISELQEDYVKAFQAFSNMPIAPSGNEQRAVMNYERSDAPYMDAPLVKDGYSLTDSLAGITPINPDDL